MWKYGWKQSMLYSLDWIESQWSKPYSDSPSNLSIVGSISSWCTWIWVMILRMVEKLSLRYRKWEEWRPIPALRRQYSYYLGCAHHCVKQPDEIVIAVLNGDCRSTGTVNIWIINTHAHQQIKHLNYLKCTNSDAWEIASISNLAST